MKCIDYRTRDWLDPRWKRTEKELPVRPFTYQVGAHLRALPRRSVASGSVASPIIWIRSNEDLGLEVGRRFRKSAPNALPVCLRVASVCSLQGEVVGVEQALP